MENKEKFYLERSSYFRIKAVLGKLVLKNKENRPDIQMFLSRLNNVEIVEDGKLPKDIIAINSYVRYKYLDKTHTYEAVLVFPADVAADQKNISIFSPLGLSMIGKKANSTSEYLAPGGIYRIRIDEVIHQKQHIHIYE